MSKELRILKSAQVIGTLVECINIEVMHDLIDARFKHPTINNHNRRLKESIQGIKLHLGTIVQVKDRDHFDYEFAVEMHRLVTHFCGMTTEQIKQIMDVIEEKIKSNDK